MAKASDKAPIYAVKRKGALSPAAEIDAEAFEAIADGSQVELTIHQRRSNPRMALYWAVLGAVVRGGYGPWKTKETLSDALKLVCDVVEIRRTLDGGYYIAPDSIAFQKMNEAQFSAFLSRAFEKLSEQLGMDPMELLPMRRAA